ncbi:carnitine 3-dehydrogenase [Amylibacter sp. IMCC11727]|uniref:carnitine 3-dehydrogenase n=1 Tax=Amylibacter sp. IMCC11727 TaxID=3039851 RepID=UPI00244DF6AB|nr:carnitine 3-dehydrogenase [Amylibacter sp. IMCC11727]WGI20919.1 carnitine 3-dehydrogenase [Amylibacter sp. IMCC11727]
MTKIAAIIGGGVIGGAWAARFLLNGWDVQVYDPDPEAERKIGEVLDNARRSLPSLSDHVMPKEGKISFHGTIAEAVTGARYIQESVPERMDIKHLTFTAITEACSKDAVIGSSTSSFTPTELSSQQVDKSRIMVCHPFNPVYLLPLVEVVGGTTASEDAIETCMEILTEIGMKPLKIQKEILGHIADRLLESVWREGLWLIKDGICDTETLDDAMRFGFGLRWAQMGLFETYRIAGGEAGMLHFISQFGPTMEWPLSKLMDVPELDDALIKKVADQSDAQSGMYSIRELERIRDTNLVGMMRALKAQNWGAGSVLANYDAGVKEAIGTPDMDGLVRTVARTVPLDWLDYNGHMNEARYLQAFGDATDRFMELIGCDAAYIAKGGSYFTAETHIRHLDEAKAGEVIEIDTQVVLGAGKKMHLFHFMKAADGRVLATAEHMLIHVSLETRKAAPPAPEIEAKLVEVAKAHEGLPVPEGMGRFVGQGR